ncbi:NADH-quinone oxidoreductase subunit N [Pelagibius sp. Alg239-R121]|uniref:NADH-quinone oxidoreductase subunit N n=1 Tax=Pelagibius sp. Alg239-R121 TaxID=2993448 RepID=UPI0024A6ED2A|nr:NADH-quinone oxidoreductase subunit N [Pelagibius sp. Alg239-R121]
MDKQAIIRSIIVSSPEIIVILGACLMLFVALMKNKHQLNILTGLSLAIVVLAAGITAGLVGAPQSAYGDTFVVDGLAIFFKAIFFLATALTLFISKRYLEEENIGEGEYHALLLFALVGMMIMVSGRDLLVIYMGLELQALAFYVLVGYQRRDPKSTEAALKYVILGAVSSGIFLYGLSLVYGLTGTTELSAIAVSLSGEEPPGLALILAILFLMTGLLFKLGAVPFHMWVPDVYEGAPTPITAYLSVASKAAAFAIVLRIFLEGMNQVGTIWIDAVTVIAVITMALGSFVALVQTNIKRMLAYSSIAHAGIALLGIVAGGQDGVASVMLYLLIYTFMNLGMFAIIVMMRSGAVRGDNIDDYTGLATSHPFWAFLALIFLFSLAGIPPTAGFFAKFYILVALINQGYVVLAVIAVLLSAVAAYFYIRVIMVMYMKPPTRHFDLALTPMLRISLVVAGIGTVGIGLIPGWFLDQAQNAAFEAPLAQARSSSLLH